MSLAALLGVELPLIQAPMAGVQDGALAAAVAATGALGSLPCAMLGPDNILEQVAAMRTRSGAAFNLNFFCHQTPAPDADAQARWFETLRPYYAEFGLDPERGAAGAARTPFNEDALACVEACRPAVVSFHFGLPEARLLARVKASGARVLGSATTVAEATWLAAHGVDAIVAQGLEAGGHRGMFLDSDLTTQSGTFTLLRQICAAVTLPVIAAGGIADAAGVRAALALGAAGVQVGTAYLCCAEATTSTVHRAALASPAARHTAVTNVFSGRPARGIVNRVMRELGPISSRVPAFPLAAAALGPLRAAAEAQGSGDFSPLWAGQNVAGCRDVPAAEITHALAAGFE